MKRSQNIDTFCNTGTITRDISDPDDIFLIIEQFGAKFTTASTNLRFNLNNFVQQDFLCDHVSCEWDNETDVNTAHNNSIKEFSSKCKTYLVKSCNRSLTIKKPWVTEGIMKSITTKNKMYGELNKQPFNVKLTSITIIRLS